MYGGSRFVTKRFYDELLSRAPMLKDTDLRAAFSVLLFPIRINKKMGKKSDEPGFGYLIPAKSMAYAMGKEKQFKSRNFSAIRHLDKLYFNVYGRTNLLKNFTIWGHDYTHQRARALTYEFSDDFERLLRQELGDWRMNADPNELIHMVTGQSYDSHFQGRERAALEDELADYHANHKPKPADLTLRFVNYLNSLPPNTFTTLCRENFPRAVHTALDEKNYVKRLHTLSQLYRCREQPKPYYRISEEGRTSRVFPANTSFVTLPGKYREIMTTGCFECDLQNSQLAIVAWRWEIPMLQEFCETGKSIWREIADVLQVEDFRGIKQTLKQVFLYPVIYGRQTNWATMEMIKSGELTREQAQQIFDMPLISAVLEARSRQVQKLLAQKTFTTFLGSKVPLGGTTATKKQKVTQINSALARDAQGIELWLMEAILEKAATSRDFSIILHQHDGMTIKVRKEKRTMRVKERLSEAIKERGDSVGIHAVLEWR